MEQSLPDDVTTLRGILSSLTGVTTAQIDGFIEIYIHFRAYGFAHRPQLVPAFVAAVIEGVTTAAFATLLEDLTFSLNSGFMRIVVRIIAPGQKQEYEHQGLWGPERGLETQSRVRP